MKKIIIPALLSFGLISSALAQNGFTPFTTLAQARLYCPSEKGLIFNAFNPTLPNSLGTISAYNQKQFNSFPGNVIHPKFLNNHVILDAQFRIVGGAYGYNSNGVVTCYYSYASLFNSSYDLVMRGM